jgi:hypothetical protein
MKTLNFLCLMICSQLFVSLTAQSSINSAGGNGNSSNGSFSFSVGQVDYTFSSSPAASFSSGVQQGFKISTNNVTILENNLNIYPNPITDYISISLPTEKSLEYTIFNSSGKIILFGRINKSDNVIILNNLKSGIYFINIENKTNKIIKI